MMGPMRPILARGPGSVSPLAGARDVDGHVWGVDPLERHDVSDGRFTFIQADPMEVAGRWERIDLLHLDIDPLREDDARRWLGVADCRQAVHDFLLQGQGRSHARSLPGRSPYGLRRAFGRHPRPFLASPRPMEGFLRAAPGGHGLAMPARRYMLHGRRITK